MKAALRPTPSSSAAYCGPTALAALTGHFTEGAENAIRAARKVAPGTPVVGVCMRDMKAAAPLLGLRLVEVPLEGLERREYPEGWGTKWRHGYRVPATLAAMLRRRGAALRKRPLLVMVTGHYVAVQGNRFVDTARREGCLISQAPGRRVRVKRVFVALGDEDTLAPGELYQPWKPAAAPKPRAAPESTSRHWELVEARRLRRAR